MPPFLKLALDFRFPEAVQIGAHDIETGPVNPVDTPGAIRMVRDQTGGLQNLEMLGYRGTADRQAARQAGHIGRAIPEPFKYQVTGGIAQSSEA